MGTTVPQNAGEPTTPAEAMPSNGQVYITDALTDFTMGVDSGRIPLVVSSDNPNGLRRDQIAWLTNGSCRGGGITQRAGWKKLAIIHDGTSLYQGGFMYEPDSGLPYLMLSIGGHIWQVQCVLGALPVDLSAVFGGTTNPDWPDQAFFCQGEEFLFIQAGDYGLTPAPVNPLIWDGATLGRSLGLHNPPNPALDQIPAAGPMNYYMQRLWYAQGRTTNAGDIVGGAHGTIAYNFRDAIAHVTENPLAAMGDGFTVPAFAGSIRALAHSAAIDAALGEGQLFVFTRKYVFNLKVPITRADWTSTTEPLQKVIQNKYGTPAERSVVSVNGDLFYQTMEPGIRTMALAVRYFNQWANTPISRNLNRLIPFQDRALLRFGSGMLFDNRLYQTCLPFASGDAGVAHSALAVLDFDILSSFHDQLQGAPVPAWEGIHDGLDILQVFQGDFGGLDRAFAVTVSRDDGTIQLWELTSGDKFENGDNRVTFTVEFPALDWGNIKLFKELQGGHLWLDRITGRVDVLVEFRSDEDSCWHWWQTFDKCYARTSCEDLVNPICYPVQPYGEGWERPLSLPHPNAKECASNSSRPACFGYSFQVRLTIKGFCRVRGLFLFATPRQLSLYSNQVC